MAGPVTENGTTSDNVARHPLTPEEADKLAAAKEEQPANIPATYAANLTPSDSADPLDAIDDAPVKFESAEHSAIADNLMLYNTDGTRFEASSQALIANWPVSKWPWPITKTKKIDLKFGRAIALAGDYFTNPGSDTSYKSPHGGLFKPAENPDYLPICGAGGNDGVTPNDFKRRFGGMVWAIENDYNNNLYDLMPLMDSEVDKIQAVVKDNSGMEAIAYHLGDGLPDTKKLEEATINSYNARTGLYAWLLLINYDHFGDDAVTCYTAGHMLALERARAAAKIKDSTEQQKALNRAYLAEAAACHFLTDLFSSGHARTPRRAFHVCKGIFPDDITTAEMAAAHLAGSVVWDEMTHIIHDDDSATGLVVKNALGEFWTAFGDKQYFMPANTNNRMRCMQCVQASIDEVFHVGFQGSAALDSASFKALQLIPLPTQCVKGNDFDAIAPYNTMPLWLVTKNDLDPSQDFWYRKDPNDHADYGLSSPTKPDFFTKICESINDYSFVKGDQFPTVYNINIGASGVLQLMQAQDAKSNVDSLTANIYGVISPEKVSKDWKSSLTLRHQARSFHSNSHTKDGVIVHTCSYVPKSGNGLSYIFIFSAKQGAGASSNSWDVSVSCFQVKDNTADLTVPLFDPKQDKQSHPEISAKFKNLPLLATPDPGSGSTLEKEVGSLRFFVGPYYPGSTDLVPAIITVRYSTSSSKCKIWAAILDSTMTTLTGKSDQVVDLSNSILSVKPLPNGGGLFADTVVPGESPSWTANALKFDAASGQVTTKALPSVINFPPADPKLTSWLTGTLTPGSDNAVVNIFHTPHPNFNLAIRHEGSHFSAAAHTCQSSNTALTLKQSYFDAIALGSATDTKIISVALMKSSDASVGTCVYIRTHVKSADPSTTFKCYDSVIKDEFATKDRIDGGYYYNIAWLMVSDPDSTCPGAPGLLQVFSFYGCVGFRLFGVRTTGQDAGKIIYSLKGVKDQGVGQQCYNGQTSKEMGSSVSKLFGSGIMNWRMPGFEDISVFTPQIRGTSMTAGSWDAYGGQQATKLGTVLDGLLNSGGKGWRWGTNMWWQ